MNRNRACPDPPRHASLFHRAGSVLDERVRLTVGVRGQRVEAHTDVANAGTLLHRAPVGRSHEPAGAARLDPPRSRPALRDRDRWAADDLRANVQNVTGARYWTGVASFGTFFQGAPRTYLLSMAVDL